MNICIVGTGYVGLVSAACFAEMGNTVACVDINPDVVARLKKGEVHIYEPGLDVMVRRNTQEGRLTFTTDLAEGMKDSLFIFCCVGTPEGEDGTADLRYVKQVASSVGQTMTGYTSSSTNRRCRWARPTRCGPSSRVNWTSATCTLNSTSSPTPSS